MSDVSSDFGSTPSVGLGNAMLLSLTLTVVTLACGLATFVTNTHAVDRLREAGYVAWSGASVWADIQLPSPSVSAGSSVWYRILPGGKLAFAFTTLPQLRAGAAAASFFIGGMLALSAVAGAGSLKKNKTVGIGFGLFLCLAGIAAAFPSAPDGFCIDLTQGTITTGLQPGAPVTAFNVSDGFYERTHYSYGRHHHSSTAYLEAMDANGQEIDIIALGSESQVYQLADTLNNFINSQGVQI